MKILVVDDGQLAINSLIRILCRVAPDCDYISAMTTDDALTWLRQGPMDAAFLNLEMPGMNGLALARMIQKIQPRCNLIVVTEHPEYALEALQIFVSGFLLKPANEADVRNMLENLRYPAEDVPADAKAVGDKFKMIYTKTETDGKLKGKADSFVSQTNDPGAGSALANGKLLVVYV